jgi:hypothetical protein
VGLFITCTRTWVGQTAEEQEQTETHTWVGMHLTPSTGTGKMLVIWDSNTAANVERVEAKYRARQEAVPATLQASNVCLSR